MIAIILLNYKNYKVTIDCIKSVTQSNYSDYKIFLVDNGSYNLEQLKVLESEKIEVFGTKNNLGYVGGINYGINQALKVNPDYLLIMNNDTLIDKQAISNLVNTANTHNNDCIVSGKVYNMDDPNTLQYIGQWCRNFNTFDFPAYIKNERELDVGQFENEIEMDMLDDIYWLIPSKVFKKVGYYSPYFFLYGEQNDYAIRAKKNGFKLIYTPTAKIWHYEHLSSGNGSKFSLRVFYWQFYSTLTLTYLHLPLFYFILFYFKNLIKSIIKYLKYGLISKSLNGNIALAKLKGYYYFTKWLFNKRENKGFNPYL